MRAVLQHRKQLRASHQLRLNPKGPTRLHMDANAVLLGVQREKVAKEMRYVACRYAMLRSASDNKDLVLLKVDTQDNRADLCTKPLIGRDFERHRASILGVQTNEEQAL